jgi:hypothetical protein
VNIVILNWQRPLWEGDQEVMKGSGRDEPIWFAIHMCMESTLGISLYSYLYLKLAKTPSFLLSLMFSLQQNWIKQCIHMSKCKNDKKKKEKRGVSLILSVFYSMIMS